MFCRKALRLSADEDATSSRCRGGRPTGNALGSSCVRDGVAWRWIRHHPQPGRDARMTHRAGLRQPAHSDAITAPTSSIFKPREGMDGGRQRRIEHPLLSYPGCCCANSAPTKNLARASPCSRIEICDQVARTRERRTGDTQAHAGSRTRGLAADGGSSAEQDC
jgi:hypothetical protein